MFSQVAKKAFEQKWQELEIKMAIYDFSLKIDIEKARKYLNKAFKEKAKVEIVSKKEKNLTEDELRNAKTNAYMHALINYFACIEGYTSITMKSLLKRRCSFMHDLVENEKIEKSTRNEKKLIHDFVEWLRNHGLEKHGIYIPTGEEYLSNWQGCRTEIDREIKINRVYL